MRVLTKRRFLDEIVSAARRRTAADVLHLAPGSGGVVVRWEEPGVGQPVPYRVTDDCPHCAILEAVAAVLPPDDLRRQYEAVLRTGRRPHLVLARPGRDSPWRGSCAAQDGDPHADADCDRHSRFASLFPLPAEVLSLYGTPQEAEVDVRGRLATARGLLAAAAEVAGDRAAAAATLAFLRTRALLGLPVAGVDSAVIALRPAGRVPPESPLRLRPGVPYPDGLCLVPDPARTRRLPFYADSVEVITAEPMRTVRLPAGTSRLGGGAALLCQARRARGVPAVPGRDRPPGHWETEADLHIFEFDVLRAVAGEAYEDAVGAFHAAMLRERDMLRRPERVLSRSQRAALARAFGGAEKWEVALWASAAHRNAILNVIGGRHPYAEYLRLLDGG
nr:hypothetical protein [uncultured Actinoplanes sp.]